MTRIIDSLDMPGSEYYQPFMAPPPFPIMHPSAGLRSLSTIEISQSLTKANPFLVDGAAQLLYANQWMATTMPTPSDVAMMPPAYSYLPMSLSATETLPVEEPPQPPPVVRTGAAVCEFRHVAHFSHSCAVPQTFFTPKR